MGQRVEQRSGRNPVESTPQDEAYIRQIRFIVKQFILSDIIERIDPAEFLPIKRHKRIPQVYTIYLIFQICSKFNSDIHDVILGRLNGITYHVTNHACHTAGHLGIVSIRAAYDTHRMNLAPSDCRHEYIFRSFAQF